jgi:PAS domain S-box-containing protein
MKAKPVILVVDDLPQNIALIAAHLVPHGYEIIKAANGEEALKKLSGNPIDLILLDVMMPGMDGFEVTRRVRQDNTYRLLPIILVTALRDTEDRVKGIEAGCDDFLSKPVDWIELLARVRSLLKVKAYNDLMNNYRLVVENAKEAIIVTQDLKLVFVNRAALDMIGYSGDILTPRPFTDFIHPDDLNMVTEHHLRRIKGEEVPPVYSFRVLRQDGTVKWVEINAAVIQWQGKPATLNFLNDITDRRRAEEALKESENKYRLLADNVNDVIFVLDMNLHYTYVSPSVKILRGYKPAEALKQSPIETLTSSSWDLALRTLSEVMELEKSEHREIPVSRTLELEMVRKDRTTVWTEVKFSIIRDENQQPVGILGLTRDIADRRRAEEALRNSEGRLHTLVQTIPDLIWLKDKGGAYLSCNTMFERFFGAREADIIGKNDYDFVDQDLADSFREHDRKAMAAGRPTNKEEWITFADDGHRAFVDTIKTPMYDTQGTLIGVLGIGRDVTERKRAEEELKKSEEKYRNILESIEEGYFEVDLAGNFTFVNDAQCRNLGYPREELIGRNNQLFTDERASKDLYLLFTQIFQTGNPVKVYDLNLVKKDKTKSVNEISAALIRNTEGKPVGFRGISRDVTERNLAEIKLRNYADEISELYNNAPCGYHSLGADGLFIRINDTELNWIGYERDEIVGRKKWRDLLTPDSQINYDKYFPIFKKQGWINDLEFDVIRKDGSIFPVLRTATAVRDKEGNFIEGRATIFDITELKKARSKLEETNLELVRTYEELREKQVMIVQQEKMASIGVLAAGVAHEIKNPLAIMLQGVNYLQSTVSDDSLQTEVVARLHNAVLRADAIVKGLLSYARQHSLTLTSQDIWTLIDECLTLTEHEFRKKNIRLIRQYIPNLPKISVDSNQIKQVFVNLFINGIDAMQKGGTFTINARQIADAAGKNFLEITFKDTGHGIPADKINKIFDPFYTTKAVGSTGLGLSISRGIIDKHEGTIYAESEVGQGTSMIIKLPIPL